MRSSVARSFFRSARALETVGIISRSMIPRDDHRMIRHISLCGLEQLSNFVSQFFKLLKFCQIGLAAIEEVAILVQECRYIVLQILDFEIV